MAWLPLESNPELLVGFGVPKKWQVIDIYSLDTDSLAVVPTPVLAVILLFPITPKYEEYEKELEKKIEGCCAVAPKDIIFVKQYIKNACGTYALIHSIVNNTDKIELNDGPLKNFIEKVKGLNGEEAGKVLQNLTDIAEVHENLAAEGQTEAPPADSVTEHHFVAFIQKNGYLYELDGRKSVPTKHQATTEETFLQDAAKVVKGFMERDPGNIGFTVLALTAAE